MLIKAIHYKGKSLYRAKQKVRYLLVDGGHCENVVDNKTLLLNFTTEADPARLHLEFLKNAKHLKKRKNGVVLYHFVLSFSKIDSPNITDEMLMDIMKKFIELRGIENNVVLGKIHSHESHKHIHVFSSSNPLESSSPVRINRNQLKTLCRSMEEYQLERYGKAMGNSIVKLNRPLIEKVDYVKRDRTKRHRKEVAMKERLGNRKTRKEVAKEMLDNLLAQADSFNDFVNYLKDHMDFELYSYRSKTRGVIYLGKKYRWSTLNIDASRLMKFQEIENKLRQLALIRETFKGQSRGLEL